MAAPIVQSKEQSWIARAREGDDAARRWLFEQYREPAFAVALRVTRRREDALDVVQDAFIKAFERLDGFQQESGFKTWLLRIVTNTALDLLRSRRVRLAASLDDDAGAAPPVAGDDPAPGAGLEQAELRDRLAEAIATLPAEQQAVFALYASGDLTYGQIAAILGVPIGTVMSRLFLARKRLKTQLADLE